MTETWQIHGRDVKETWQRLGRDVTARDDREVVGMWQSDRDVAEHGRDVAETRQRRDRDGVTDRTVVTCSLGCFGEILEDHFFQSTCHL